MCQIFVENCREDDEQLVLFYYWMLDICECYEDLQEMNVAKKFKNCLQLSQDKSLLVESLWLLDHQLFKVCLYVWSPNCKTSFEKLLCSLYGRIFFCTF